MTFRAKLCQTVVMFYPKGTLLVDRGWGYSTGRVRPYTYRADLMTVVAGQDWATEWVVVINREGTCISRYKCNLELAFAETVPFHV